MEEFMIGQEKLKAHFEKLIAFDKLPRFILLVGSQGSGKRTLANWIVQESDIDYEFITDQKVDSIRSVIESALTLRDRKIFVFPNAENMNLSAQNAFLKTLEEPPNNAYIIMTVNNLLSILGNDPKQSFRLHNGGIHKGSAF
jgi:DNA polymerase-3 subunit delta'